MEQKFMKDRGEGTIGGGSLADARTKVPERFHRECYRCVQPQSAAKKDANRPIEKR
jgi:hypothetical protein